MVVRELTGGDSFSVFALKINYSPLKTYDITIKEELIQKELFCHVNDAGIYFGKPRGFGTNEDGDDIGFNTEVYSTSEV